MLIFALLGLIVGIVFVQFSSVLLSLGFLWAGALLPVLLFIWLAIHYKTLFLYKLLCLILFFIIGSSYTILRAENRLDNNLYANHNNKVSTVAVLIDSLPEVQDNSIRFDATVLESIPDQGIPKNIRLSWPLTQFAGPYSQAKKNAHIPPEFKPGQVWQMSVLLKRNRALLNPYLFDYESHQFAQNIRATGIIKGSVKLLAYDPFFNWSTLIEHWRYQLRLKLQRYLNDKRYGAVIIALVIGDQQAIAKEDWELFNKSGITHLISISGTHITMLAFLGSSGVFLGLKRLKRKGKHLSDKKPIRFYALYCGLIIAYLYCQLAGWGIPAQRTFLMLLIAIVLLRFKQELDMLTVLLITAAILLLLDPWAILTSGFYLSFFAVLTLILIAKQVLLNQSKKDKIFIAIYSQLMMSIALVPFLMVLFKQVSIISPLVNAYAIPIIGLFITPASLLLSFLVLFDVSSITQWWADITHGVLFYTLELSAYFTQLNFASIDVAVPHSLSLVMAIMGILLFVLPKGLPFPYISALFFLPLFFIKSDNINKGEWTLWVFDTGQSGAALLRSQQHVLLFDTGLRRSWSYEDGTNIIVPALKAMGISHIDTLVVSHSDLDHSGGLASVLSAFSVERSFSSFDIAKYLQYEKQLLNEQMPAYRLPHERLSCHAGIKQSTNDGLELVFLNQKPKSAFQYKSDNNQSCVLHVQGQYHRVLFTGDIGFEQEKYLSHQAIQSDIVLMPHHGSKYSSSEAFINAVQAKYAIAQSAYHNRYGHPAPETLKRWTSAGVNILRTDLNGALMLK